MSIFQHRPNICKLAAQLEHIERELQRLESLPNHLPNAAEMKALGYMRFKLPQMTNYIHALDAKLWQRIETWQNTPYTAQQLRWRKIVSFVGWWVVGTIVITQSVLGWFANLFPEAWHIFPVSAIIALAIIAYIANSEAKS